jgi:hypothetical protein
MAKLLTANPTPEDWKDTRPDFLQEMDIESLEAGLTPTWDDGERKYNRFISFEEHQVDKAAGLARLLGVVKSNEYKPGPRNFLTKASLNSEFWEAIGLGWLTPVNQPVHYFRTKVRKPKTELAW